MSTSGPTPAPTAGPKAASEGPALKVTSTFTTEDGVRYAADEDPDHVMSMYLPDGEEPSRRWS